MVVNPLQGAPLPPEPDTRFYEVVSHKVGMSLPGTILSPGFTGFWMHWDGRPWPCPGPEGCDRCRAGIGHRWTGYTAFQLFGTKKSVILQLSEGAARQLLPLIAKHGNLRGFMVSLTRKSQLKRNSPVVVAVSGRQDPGTCPEDFDILPSLAKLWDMNASWLRGGGMSKPPAGQWKGPGIPRPHLGHRDGDLGERIPV